jgi:hypothetical protein
MVGSPSGQIMNSWKSSGLAAWTPPLRTLKHGTGSRGVWDPIAGRNSKSSLPWEAATARVKAIETPRIALAPSVALFGVAVQVDEGAVELLDGLEGLADDGFRDRAGDIADRLEHPHAGVAGRIAVSQFDGLAGAGGGAGGDLGLGTGAVVQGELDLDGRAAARIENLEGAECGDRWALLLLNRMCTRFLHVQRRAGTISHLAVRESSRAGSIAPLDSSRGTTPLHPPSGTSLRESWGSPMAGSGGRVGGKAPCARGVPVATSCGDFCGWRGPPRRQWSQSLPTRCKTALPMQKHGVSGVIGTTWADPLPPAASRLTCRSILASRIGCCRGRTEVRLHGRWTPPVPALLGAGHEPPDG